MNRRSVLALGAATTGMMLAPAKALTTLPTPSLAPFPRLVTAARIGGVDRGAILGASELVDFALPARAHGSVSLPNGRALLVARRPGTYAALIDNAGETPAQFVQPLPSQRFSGHAAYAAYLVTAELHEDNAEGVAVVRDSTNGAIRDVWHLGGIEPHEMLFADGGARLIVALGGIAKAAGVKGPAMNLGHIESEVLELDAVSGRTLKRHTLPPELSTLSLRHMALAPDGKTIAVAMQDQDRSFVRPLLAILRVGQGLEILPLPDAALRFYVGSVAIDSAGQFIAATSPKGGCLALWSLSNGKYLGRVDIADVCGLTAASEAGTFWATSGLGDVVRVAGNEFGPRVMARWHANVRFDNHLLRI